MLASDPSRRDARATTSAERDRTARIGAQIARRLTHELEVLEESLLAAERAALSHPTRLQHPADSNADIASRRAELDRRELALRERERSVEDQRQHLIHARDQLVRTKESLKRAVRRFHSRVAQHTSALDKREQRIDAARADLIEDRRAFRREQIRLKERLRVPSGDAERAAINIG